MYCYYCYCWVLVRMRGNTEDIAYTRFGIFCVLSLMLYCLMLMCVLLGCLVCSMGH